MRQADHKSGFRRQAQNQAQTEVDFGKNSDPLGISCGMSGSPRTIVKLTGLRVKVQISCQ